MGDGGKTFQVPIADTITTIKGYPEKLKLYKIRASQFWQVRTYENGNWIKRSTKTESKMEAISFAKDFFEEIVAKRSQSKYLTKVNTFYALSQQLLEDMEAKVARGELTDDTFKNAKYRFSKHLSFNRYRLGQIPWLVNIRPHLHRSIIGQ